MATTDTQQAAQFSAEAAVSAAEAKQYLIEAQQGYQDTSAAAQEAKDAAAAAATSEQNATYSEANAAQSAAAAVDAKVDAEAAASSASDYAKNKFTFYKTASDPDGTIAGLAATTDGQSFWVAQGPDALSAAWQYQNKAGVAVLQAKQPGTAAITGTIREFPTLEAAQADADAGNIPVGSTAYYRIPDDSALAIEVINNAGTLQPTGRKMPSQEFIDLIAAQVTAEITARLSLVDVIPPAWSKYLAVIKDAAGYEAWGIDKEDGSPTDHTIAVWMRKMEQTKSLPVLRNIPGYGLAFTMPDLDGEERLTDLSLRSSDGQFHDWVLERWATRMAPVLQPLLNVATRPTPAGTWKHPSGDYVPYVTDLRTIVGLGSSSTSRSNSTYTAMAGDFGAAYVSMGTSGAIIAQNAAHIGAVPALITVSGGSIPASGGVAVTASNIPSNGINMAMGGTLAGVPGAIAWSSGNTGTFTRSASGTAVTVPDGTPFIPNSSKYRANQIILESGKNDINQNRDAAYILTMTETIVDWLAPFLSTAVVMGHFNNHAYTTAQKTTLAAVNAGIVSTYGNRAIDQQAWLVSSTIWDQLAAEGVTPTTQDLADQAAGLPPTQLMVAEKDHLTPAAYGYRMKYLVKPKLIELGLYKETN
ncbi:hypothetical protein [Klebsiella pneumoniae]|uniref:hypothetical protein n=1 Tax=Klebsiella pneumoniae TaxID=573 RepID=UPI00217DBD8B|nr:hypothetical protein [Klebsiella pneumoniae]